MASHFTKSSKLLDDAAKQLKKFDQSSNAERNLIQVQRVIEDVSQIEQRMKNDRIAKEKIEEKIEKDFRSCEKMNFAEVRAFFEVPY